MIFLVFIGCTTSENGSYVLSENGSLDTLYLNNGIFERHVEKDKHLGKYKLDDGNITFYDWINKGELSMSKDTLTLDFFMVQGFTGQVQRIIVDHDEGLWYYRIR